MAEEKVVSTEKTEEQNTSIQQVEQFSASKRFTDKVLTDFSGSVAGALEVTDYQRSLIQGYFVAIDRALKNAEEERKRKNAKNKDHKYDNPLPVTWKNVNMTDLALDLVHYARVGLDMMQENMLFPIPYRNVKNDNYDITLMEGYNGIRYIAEKYALEVPTAVTVEVVYSTDNFRPIKKGGNNRVDSYIFEITNPFSRGEIVGAFAYIEFADPTRNELVIMSMRDIMKRKPKYASPNFWGGTMRGEDGKEVSTEGWLDEMVRKTIVREAYSAKHLPRDPKKIDDSYQYMKYREAHFTEIEAQQEIDANANAVLIDTSKPKLTATPSAPTVEYDQVTGEVYDIPEDVPPVQQNIDNQNEPDF